MCPGLVEEQSIERNEMGEEIKISSSHSVPEEAMCQPVGGMTVAQALLKSNRSNKLK